MEKKEILKIARTVSKKYGFSSKNILHWKRYVDLTAVVSFNSSRSCNAMDINYGVITNSMVTKSTPPGFGYWGRFHQAGNKRGKFRKFFLKLAGGDFDVTPELCESAFESVFCEVESLYHDSDEVRARVLKEFPDPKVWGILEDWARGKPRPPSAYWPGTHYYK